MGDDPLSKVFFISDGLMSMIKDKYKLKFTDMCGLLLLDLMMNQFQSGL